MPGVIRDPRPNQRERLFGILYYYPDDSCYNSGYYVAYEKGRKVPTNDIRYIPAGVHVVVDGDPRNLPERDHFWWDKHRITQVVRIDIIQIQGQPVYQEIFDHISNLAHDVNHPIGHHFENNSELT